jgi:flagellar motor switch protein FliM
VIEPVIDKLSNESWAAYKRSSRDAQLRQRVAQRLDAAGLTVTAILADTTIKLSELMNLQRGDVILTSKPANSPLTLMIGGKRKHIGHLGQFKGNRAFKVKRPLTPKDRV